MNDYRGMLMDAHRQHTLTAMISAMREEAVNLNITGVAVAGLYRNGDQLVTVSAVCGKFADEKYNYLAIAHSKLTEMCNSHHESGRPGRSVLVGELGYAGGAIYQAGGEYFLAVFSGARGEEDLRVSQQGLRVILYSSQIPANGTR
jgi:hypothetical protein